MEELKKLDSVLTGEKIILRHVNLKDTPAMFEYTSSPENLYWITVVPQAKISETKEGIENYFLKNPKGKYGIILKSENKLIGTIDVRDQETFYELGYVLNQKYHGQGYAFQALKLLLTEIFSKTEILEVCAKIDVENQRSNNLIQKFGFQVKKQIEETNPKLGQKRKYSWWVLNQEDWKQFEKK